MQSACSKHAYRFLLEYLLTPKLYRTRKFPIKKGGYPCFLNYMYQWLEYKPSQHSASILVYNLESEEEKKKRAVEENITNYNIDTKSIQECINCTPVSLPLQRNVSYVSLQHQVS